MNLLNHEDKERMEMILKYIEAGDLQQWNFPNIKAFNIGLREWRSNLNCITNPLMYQQVSSIHFHTEGKGLVPVTTLSALVYSFFCCWQCGYIITMFLFCYEQLIGMCSEDLIIKGNTYLSNRQTEASKLLNKVFRVKLGRGFYGECLVWQCFPITFSDFCS